MKDIEALLNDWLGQEELLGRILAKIGSEKASEILEEIAEEGGMNETLIFKQKKNEN